MMYEEIETYHDLQIYIKNKLTEKSTKRVNIDLKEKHFNMLIKLVKFYVRYEDETDRLIKMFYVDINSIPTLIRRNDDL